MLELEASGVQQFAADRRRIGRSMVRVEESERRESHCDAADVQVPGRQAEGSTVSTTYEGTLYVCCERWEVTAEVIP